MKIEGIQVPADLFVAMARVYKYNAKPVEQQTSEERQQWLECDRLERKAQAKLPRKRP